MKFKKKFVALALSSLVLGGCLSDDDNVALTAGDVFVLTSNGQLASFNRTTPSVVRTSVAISGLMAGDTLVGMDFRPRDSQLYALARTSPGNGGRLYTINTTTGVATPVAALTAHPADASTPFTTLDPAATSFGVDFNPAADALRVISNTGQNLRIFVQTVAGQTPDRQAGFTFTDTTLVRTGVIPAPTFADSASAYTNSFDGTTSTRMFNIDSTNGNLIQQTDPNGGQTRIAAPLFATPTAIAGTNGFDIDAKNNLGYALLTVGGSQTFFSIAIPDSTATQPVAGPAATSVGALNVPGVIGMALAPVAAPQVIALDEPATGPQRLLKFGLRTPNNATATNITGLPGGETLVSIDYRAIDQTVYGLSSAGRLYRVNPDTGAVTAGSLVSIAAVNPITTGIAAMKLFNIDFNPSAAGAPLRIVSTATGAPGPEQSDNLRVPAAVVNGTQADTLRDGDLAFDPTALPTPSDFSVENIAYTNSFASPQPASTRLFDVDARNNRLLLQNPPNDGRLNVTSNLTVRTVTPTTITDVGTISTYGGFDISGGDNGARLVAGSTGTDFKLYSLTIDAVPMNATNPVAVPSGTLVESPAVGTASTIGTGATLAEDVIDITIKF
jgi:hypothetical protein